MATTRKFGTFEGIFTPSILTILGVIMYLRLPTIVGQAGLLAALGIIAVAHLISVTTGLSVASVATDKKVEAGGTYYMVSRSLGLPIGGTLGIALFVGLSFSVSLYVIGFAESFLAYWGFEATRNALRLTAATLLVAVAIVTLISTAVALKIQFFILAAIALSLLSIVFGRHDMAPTGAQFDPLPTAAPFIVLFAIFFPAVTGFEAGVSMSGDLKDPKRSLPRGTVAAIGTGLLVYIGLATFLSLTVDREQLATNPRVLLDISLFAPLVAAGIWGATISSAFGSILGAPRILQATSQDRVTPGWFARTSGRTNEPRRALILTFLIALSGVAIGELDVIARIVSMFFIATYGFLNLGCAIESWTSPDFRPAFRIPKIVSVLGALACLIVMIQLDIVAMIAATVVLGLLYLYLVRRQLTLESGDAWRGFWSSVARAALHRLDREPGHRRNWRPNLLIYGTPERSPTDLVDFGRQFVSGGGLISHFELIERPGAPALLPRPVPAGQTADGDRYGVFGRRLETGDVYSAMEMVARFYGFAGVEPNTVLLEWPTDGRRDERLVGLLRALEGMQYNIMLLRSSDRGFSKRRRIDVWARPGSSTSGLELALVRALSSSDQWRSARIRFMTVNDADPSRTGSMHRALQGALDAARVDAQTVVVENFVSHRPLHELIAAESASSDLALVGLPDLPAAGADAHDYVADKTRLIEKLGTVLFVRAAPAFAEAIMLPPAHASERDVAAERAAAQPEAIELPATAELAEPLAQLATDLDRAATDFGVSHLQPSYRGHRELVRSMQRLIERTLDELARVSENEGGREQRAFAKLRGDLLFKAAEALGDYRDRGVPDQAADWTAGSTTFLAEAAAAVEACPEHAVVVPERSWFDAARGDSARTRLYKLSRRASAALRRRQPSYSVPLRAVALRRIEARTPRLLAEATERFTRDAASAVLDFERLLTRAGLALDRAEAAVHSRADDTGDAPSAIAHERDEVLSLAQGIVTSHQQEPALAAEELRAAFHRVAQAIVADVEREGARSRLRHARRWRRDAAERATAIGARVESWARAQALLIENALLDVRLLALENRVRTIVRREQRTLGLQVRNEIVSRLQALESALDVDARVRGEELSLRFESWADVAGDDFMDRLLAEFRTATAELPERIEAHTPDSVARLEAGLFEGVDAVAVSLRSVVDYRLDTELLAPLHEPLAALEVAVARAHGAARDAVKLSSLLLPEDEPERLADDTAGGSVRRVGEARSAVEDAAARLDQTLQAGIEATFESLTPHALTRPGAGVEHEIRRRRGEQLLSRSADRVRAAWRYAGERVVSLLYKRSEAVLLTRRLEARAQQTTGDELRALVASLSPRPDVLAALPFHYRHLFLGKPTFTRDFWIGWQQERQRIADVVAAHRRGTGGALILIGEPGAGKSSLAQYVARHHFASAATYRVLPPPGGSIDAGELEARIADALAGAPRADLGALPDGSLVVFEDADLWWERGEGGLAVIEQILDLADAHGERCFFLLTADAHAFRFMSRIGDLEPRFLSVLGCGPFSAREIEQAVLFRHDLTGLGFEYERRAESDLSSWRRARLFNALFDYSDGNIGVALQTWIAGISRVDGDRITINPPAPVRLRSLDVLRPMHLLLLVTLVLHRALTQERLARIAGLADDELGAELATLRRFNIVYAGPNGVLEIDRYLRPHLIRRLVQEGLIP